MCCVWPWAGSWLMGMPTPNLLWITAGVLLPVPVMQEDEGLAAYGCSCGHGCVFPGCSQCPGVSPPSFISPLGSWKDTLGTYWEYETPYYRVKPLPSIIPMCFSPIPEELSWDLALGASFSPNPHLRRDLSWWGTMWHWAAKLVPFPWSPESRGGDLLLVYSCAGFCCLQG